MSPGDQHLIAIFKTIAVKNEKRSYDENRPIFDDMEIVEIRFPGDRNRVSVFPAHEMSANIDQADGTSLPQTYAERFSEQYKQFKKKKTQAKSGTPLEELTFLTTAQRSELKALNIYTAETLADLENPGLKSLGPNGRDLKNQARAYIEHAAQSSEPVRLAAENEDLKRQIEDLRAQVKGKNKDLRETKAELAEATAESKSDFDSWSDDDLKEWIKSESGAAPRGNPSHETLVRMADEIAAEKSA